MAAADAARICSSIHLVPVSRSDRTGAADSGNPIRIVGGYGTSSIQRHRFNCCSKFPRGLFPFFSFGRFTKSNANKRSPHAPLWPALTPFSKRRKKAPLYPHALTVSSRCCSDKAVPAFWRGPLPALSGRFGFVWH